MELQKEIDPLRLEHNNRSSMQQQQEREREHEESQCDAEQAVSQHFEESFRRANHPGWTLSTISPQPQPLNSKPMPLYQITSSPMPLVITQPPTASLPSVTSSAHHSPAVQPHSPYAMASSAVDQPPTHLSDQEQQHHHTTTRHPYIDDRKAPPSSMHHIHGKQSAAQFDPHRHQEALPQQPPPPHMYIKSMPMDAKHELHLTADEARKPLGRGVKEQHQQQVLQPQYQSKQSMAVSGGGMPPKNQSAQRRDHRYRGTTTTGSVVPNLVNDRELMLVRQQQEYMARNQQEAVLIEQQQHHQMMSHQRRINEIPVEMQTTSTVGVIVKRDMHLAPMQFQTHQPQHQHQQPPTPSTQPASSVYGNKRNSYAAPLHILKPGQQSHSPSASPLDNKQPNSWPGGRIMYEYRQVPIQSLGSGPDAKSTNNAHLLYQTIVPPSQNHHQQSAPPPTKIMSINAPPMVQPTARHHIASPPINQHQPQHSTKSKVSAPAPAHIYGKPIDPNPGICSGIPVCQSRRESPSKLTYSPSPIGGAPNNASSSASSPSSSASASISLTGPPPAHQKLNEMRIFQSRHPMSTASPPLTGPQSPSPSLLIQNHQTTVSPMTSPMMHHHPANHNTALPTGGAGSPISFQTQPLDLGVSSRTDNHTQHNFNSKRKATQGLSNSIEALDVRKKRMEPAASAHLHHHQHHHHPHIVDPSTFGHPQISPATTYRAPIAHPEPRRPFAGQPPQPHIAQYEPLTAGSAQSVYVPSAVSAIVVGNTTTNSIDPHQQATRANNHNNSSNNNNHNNHQQYAAKTTSTTAVTDTAAPITIADDHLPSLHSIRTHERPSIRGEASGQLLATVAAAAEPLLAPMSLTISREADTTVVVNKQVPPIGVTKHDKPAVVNQSAPPRHLKKAWLQRHTGEDSESGNEKIIGTTTTTTTTTTGGVKQTPSNLSPSPLLSTNQPTTSPSASTTPTPPPSTPTAVAPHQPATTQPPQAPITHHSSNASSIPSITSSLSSPSTAPSTPPPPAHPSIRSSPALGPPATPPSANNHNSSQQSPNSNNNNHHNNHNPSTQSPPPTQTVSIRNCSSIPCNSTTAVMEPECFRP